MKNWVIIYDIRNYKRLAKVAKLMEQYGIRVQKSVFEMIGGIDTVYEIQDKLKTIMKLDEDYVVFFDICNSDWQKQMKYGSGRFTVMEEREYYIL